MNSRIPVALLAGALLASAALNAVQWAAHRAAPPAPEPHDLALTPAQIELISNSCQSCVDEREGLRQAIADKEQALREALAATAPDAARCRTLARELGSLRQQCVENTVDSILLVRQILTDDQVRAMVQCFDSCCGAPSGQ